MKLAKIYRHGLLCAAAVSPWIAPGHAHSNVERLMRIAANGTMVGREGYPRGFISRTDPAYSDGAVGWLIPPNGRPDGKVIHQDDKVARPTQRTANYSQDLPMLVASPGDLVALQYQENGHVTLPENQPNKPLNRGTVYVYGTDRLDPDANLLDVLYQWTADGTGGDGRGRLLATRNFDDGQCYQINGGPLSQSRAARFAKPAEDPMGQNLWCQSDVQLPSDLPVGRPYTLLWIWDWPTMDRADVATPPSSAPGAPPGPNGEKVSIPEIYTTVMDVQIVDPCDEALGPVDQASCKAKSNVRNSLHFKAGQDLNRAAVEDQCKNSFLVDAVGAGTSNSSTHGGSSAGADSTPSDAPTAASETAPATTPETTTVAAPVNERVKTETVYVTVETVTVTVEPSPTDETPSAAATATSARETPTGAPSVTPFLKEGTKKVRRRSGESALVR